MCTTGKVVCQLFHLLCFPIQSTSFLYYCTTLLVIHWCTQNFYFINKLESSPMFFSSVLPFPSPVFFCFFVIFSSILLVTVVLEKNVTFFHPKMPIIWWASSMKSMTLDKCRKIRMVCTLSKSRLSHNIFVRKRPWVLWLNCFLILKHWKERN
jgi:hypothetical protein